MTGTSNYIIVFEQQHLFRYTLIGITLVCQTEGLQVFTNFLSASVVNFVKATIEGRCGHCGQEYVNEFLNPDQMPLNHMPWVAAIKQSLLNNIHKYSTGTLVSKEYVVTAARVFETSTDEDDFEVQVGAAKWVEDDTELLWVNVHHISIHPRYNNPEYNENARFDVAIIQLQSRITKLQVPPSLAGYHYRPICLPVPGETPLEDLVGASKIKIKTLKSERALIIATNRCKSILNNVGPTEFDFGTDVKRFVLSLILFKNCKVYFTF